MPPKYVKKYASPLFAKGNAEWLMIVESSSKCGKIEGFLGDKYRCIASNGHFRMIDGIKAIDTARDYSPTFSIVKDKTERMREAIRQFPKQNIILATDDDREGEAIAWHICDTFELSLENTQRIVFHEITGDAIIKALDNKRIVNMDLVYAQFARQVLDVLVGFRISPVLWKYLYHDKNNGLSAGRCQTPALRLVYDLAMKVTPKQEETLYKVLGRFTSNNIEFTLNCELRENELNDFLTKSLGFTYILTIDVSREVTKSPPVPLNTSGLLQIASNVLRLSPKDTMALCQVLYQDGHITYMRTENTRYSREFIQTAGTYITSHYGEKFVGVTSKIESTNDNNPHEAIRVTHIELRELTDKYEGKIKSLYKLIWRRTLESCMSDAKYIVTECRISAPENKAYVTKIETPVFLGFNRDKEREKETKNTSKYLPYLKSLTSIILQSLESRIIIHNPVSYYTESGLIRKLEELGIGRPSTFASLVDVIQERKYVKCMDIEGVNLSYNEYKLVDDKIETVATTKVVGSEKDKLVIQPIGIVIVEFLSKHFNELFSYDYTSKMEKRLDTVSRECWHNVCRECDDIISRLSRPLSNVNKEAYKIDDTHDVIFSKNGPVIRSTVDGTTKFDSIRTDMTIDIDKLRNNEYELVGILQEKEIKLGEMDGHQLYIKNGKYGMYAEWGGNKQSLKSLKKSMSEITMDDISRETQPSEKILRTLNAEFSIRKGKFGPYAFYQTPSMPKPVFLNIKKFKESFTYCNPEVLINWLCETHKISR